MFYHDDIKFDFSATKPAFLENSVLMTVNHKLLLYGGQSEHITNELFSYDLSNFFFLLKFIFFFEGKRCWE